MVLAYHVIFTAYGFWLPNDPRGAWSDFVGAWALFRFGPATRTTNRRSLAGRPHDRALRLAAKQALKYPPVVFDGHQALSIARGFADVIARLHYVVHACAILPEHVHMVIARHFCKAEQQVRLLKSGASAALREDGRHPLAAYAHDGDAPHTPWAHGQWIVFLDDPAGVRRAITYVENNPVKEGKKRQSWRWVVPYRG